MLRFNPMIRYSGGLKVDPLSVNQGDGTYGWQQPPRAAA